MIKTNYLDQFSKEVNEMIGDVNRHFYYLEEKELNKNPKDGGWSILQCIEHLNLTNSFYVRQLSKQLEKASPISYEEPVSLTWKGRMLTRTMAPRQGRIPFKMPTLRMLTPQNVKDSDHRLLERVVFQNWMDDMSSYHKLIEEARNKKVDGIRIKTFAGPLFKLGLIDALSFSLAHNRRHILQAKKVLEKV